MHNLGNPEVQNHALLCGNFFFCIWNKWTNGLMKMTNKILFWRHKPTRQNKTKPTKKNAIYPICRVYVCAWAFVFFWLNNWPKKTRKEKKFKWRPQMKMKRQFIVNPIPISIIIINKVSGILLFQLPSRWWWWWLLSRHFYS